MHHIDKTIQQLQVVPGIANIRVLSEEEKRLVAALEEKNNLGVHACLAKEVTLALTHNSKFREPVAPIVLLDKEGSIFPPVPFPEVKDALSSSPSQKVHEFLVAHLNLEVSHEDATLLVGFEVKGFK